MMLTCIVAVNSTTAEPLSPTRNSRYGHKLIHEISTNFTSKDAHLRRKKLPQNIFLCLTAATFTNIFIRRVPGDHKPPPGL